MKKIISTNELLLVSIKPQYSEMIFNGTKTIELRKSVPKKAKNGTKMLIYVTSPIMELRGVCEIIRIIKTEPSVLWDKYGHKTGISKEDFFDYYGDAKKACGIEIGSVNYFNKNNLSLSILREIIPGFMPPQTYRYINVKYIKSNLLNLGLTL